ncbi:hypothetical protein LO763_00085 [Glycomyces sp. A-F 0318]|uniref:hypothetical protein n=1 Tax=Glycomyces amatae TaxID=2881355 RepID=UPI001E59C731|nr:hypothetical protein [Glycomyces amatae]MCD0442026.1 hypothetical protein [Glycomyces amatae]
MSDELPDRLRASAEEYEPDRDRMWSRVSEGMREPRGARAEPERTGWRISHLALATGAAVVLIGAVVVFGQSLGLGPVVGPTPDPPAAGPATSAPGAPDPSSGAETSTGEASETTGGEAGTTGQEESGEAGPPAWLSTDGSVGQGSNDYWSQANLTLRNDEALTELSVELRVAIGEGLQSTGAWTTDSRLSDAQVAEEDGYLVYRWTLRDGEVLPAGEYTFAGQFNHGSGPRSADDDDYTFEAATESGEDGRAEGGFA